MKARKLFVYFNIILIQMLKTLNRKMYSIKLTYFWVYLFLLQPDVLWPSFSINKTG